MKFILGIMLCVSSVAYLAEPLAVLKSHTWVSDKPATLQWLEKHRPAQAKNEVITGMFGKMTVKFTDKSVKLKLDGTEEEFPHRILGQTARELAFVTHDDSDNSDCINVFEIDEDEQGYWIYGRRNDIKEHFVPLKK